MRRMAPRKDSPYGRPSGRSLSLTYVVNRNNSNPSGGIEEEHGTVAIRVQDSGIGIAPDVLPCIFDRFTQAERSLARSEGGLGIGLALVKGLAEMHGGSVEAHSVLGQGSEFLVRLPVAADSGPGQSQGQAITPASQPLRILVVDDSLDLSRILRLTFEADGHQVRMSQKAQPPLKQLSTFNRTLSCWISACLGGTVTKWRAA